MVLGELLVMEKPALFTFLKFFRYFSKLQR